MTNPALDNLDVNNQQEQKIKIELTIQDLNTVMAALQELPHRVADPVLKRVFTQAQSQLGSPTQQ